MKSFSLLATALICGFVLMGCQRWSDSSRDETIIRGQRIVEALEAFNMRHFKYPQRLAELVPDYLPAIPSPEAGNREWLYDSSEKGFVLRVEDDASVSGTSLAYASGSKRWVFKMDERNP